MNLFIFGITGRMGRSLIACAAEHTDVRIVQTLDACDVVLDFSVSEAAETHIQDAHAARKPLVLGTTGLPATAFNALKTASKDIPIIQSVNFSLGIALCLESAKRIGNTLGHAHFEIVETHHTHKKDRPSGTALALAEALNQPDIAIHSLREGETIGEHRVIVTTPHETLEIKHTAHSRAAFAAGAITAARWLLTQSPGLYTQVNSKIGIFANLGAPDFCPAKQALSEGNRADAAGQKYGDAEEGKNPSFEFTCV